MVQYGSVKPLQIARNYEEGVSFLRGFFQSINTKYIYVFILPLPNKKSPHPLRCRLHVNHDWRIFG